MDDSLQESITFFTASCGSYYQGRDNLLLVQFSTKARVGMVTTQSSIVAAPVIWCRKRQASKVGARALLVNAGNANCYTGSAGLENVRIMAQKAAEKNQCPLEETWVCSTGVIGESLCMENILSGMDALRPCSLEDAAKAIITTDTRHKIAHREHMFAFSKGAGMMAPNMATLLCFAFVDAGLDQVTLQRCLKKSADETLNCVHIDGDTSTNDTLLLFDIGNVKRPKMTEETLQQNLTAMLADLSLQHVHDGEGTSRVLRLHITEAESQQEGKDVFSAVANSLLVKTALAGGDPNWGRFIAAIGKSQVPVDNRLRLFIGGQQVIENGSVKTTYNEEKARGAFALPIVDVQIALGRGVESYKGWGCDINERYININANYRS